MTLRKLLWMVQGRQSSEWAQTRSIHLAIQNIFADKPVDLIPLIPAHLRGPRRESREPSAEEIKQNWSQLRGVVRAGEKRGRV